MGDFSTCIQGSYLLNMTTIVNPSLTFLFWALGIYLFEMTSIVNKPNGLIASVIGIYLLEMTTTENRIKCNENTT